MSAAPSATASVESTAVAESTAVSGEVAASGPAAAAGPQSPAATTGPQAPVTVPRQPAGGAIGTGRPAQRLRMLDGLRLLAALSVVFWHYVGQADPAWQADGRQLFGRVESAAAYGWLGVELFFVISGFVICMSAWGRPVGDFAVSRIVRLFPAYWFAVLALTAIALVDPVMRDRLVSTEFLVNLTMLQQPLGVPPASSVFWTLWLELHFYLLFGIVVWRGLTYRRTVAFCALWTLASVFAAGVNDPKVSLLVGERYSPFFIAGVTAYLMYRFRPNLLLWGMLGVSWALGLLKAVPMVRGTKQYIGYPLAWRPAAVIITVIFLLIVAIALGWFDRVQFGWLTVAGALTYPLYLLHLETGWLAIRLLHPYLPPWVTLLVTVGAMLVLAWAVNRFVERPVAPWLRGRLRSAVAEVRARD